MHVHLCIMVHAGAGVPCISHLSMSLVVSSCASSDEAVLGSGQTVWGLGSHRAKSTGGSEVWSADALEATGIT